MEKVIIHEGHILILILKDVLLLFPLFYYFIVVFLYFFFIITSPRGKKSKPTICSNNEDLPDDWEPNTAIRGRLMYRLNPTSRSLSTRLITFRKFPDK